MLVCILFILVSWNGVSGSSDICRESLSSACIKIRPVRPKTAEELEKVCLILQRTISCVRNYAENCVEGMVMDEMYAIDAYSYGLTRICGTDSLLHHSVMGCSLLSSFSCSLPDEAEEFPRTEGDLDQICLHYARRFECLKDYADKCGGYEKIHQVGHPFSENRYKQLKDLCDDICLKESQLHLRIVQNIGCLREVYDISPYVCREYLRNRTAVLRKYISDKEDEEDSEEVDEDGEDLRPPFTCVAESLRAFCFSSEASKRCGSDALEIVLEVVRRSGSMGEHCLSVREDLVNELIRVLELETEEERSLKEIKDNRFF